MFQGCDKERQPKIKFNWSESEQLKNFQELSVNLHELNIFFSVFVYAWDDY